MPKQKQILVVGNWSNATGAFEPLEIQPPEPLTKVTDVVQWVKETLGREPGAYEFVRKVPGRVEIEHQLHFAFYEEV